MTLMYVSTQHRVHYVMTTPRQCFRLAPDYVLIVSSLLFLSLFFFTQDIGNWKFEKLPGGGFS